MCGLTPKSNHTVGVTVFSVRAAVIGLYISVHLLIGGRLWNSPRFSSACNELGARSLVPLAQCGQTNCSHSGGTHRQTDTLSSRSLMTKSVYYPILVMIHRAANISNEAHLRWSASMRRTKAVCLCLCL